MTSPPLAVLPKGEHLQRRLTVDGLDFEVQLSGARRSIGITVDRDGSLIVNAPHDCDEAELARFAHEKRIWIYKKLAEKDVLLSRRPTKEFVSGEGFTYLGRSYRLLIRDGLDEPMKLIRGRLVMKRDLALAGSGARAMVDWYRKSALRWLPQRLEPWARRMGLSPPGIDIRDLGYRWGSLGKSRMNFHWATIQLSPPLVDYVLVHELAHIHYPNHAAEFWILVERVLPTFRAAKAQLAHEGSSLWLGESNPAAIT